MAEVQAKGANGYLAVKPTPDSAAHIAHLLEGIGLADAIPAHKLHVTLYYAPDGLPDLIHDSVDPTTVHIAFAKATPRLLGEDPWRALVLELEAPSLHQRHQAIRDLTGVAHSYPDYTPHLSLKYGPADGDMEKVAALINGLPGMALCLHGEYCEDLKGD